MRKLQQFYVMKFLSGRLANSGFNIVRDSITTAREKQEIVSLADSQALRTIRHIRYKRQRELNFKPLEYTKERLEYLITTKKRLLKQEPTNREERATIGNKIRAISKEINDILYIPEYVLVKIESPEHYRIMIKKGLFITQVDPITKERKRFRYVRLLCGAGMARNNTVAFIREDYEEELKRYLRNDMNDVKITENKFNAYFALSSTATHTLSTPKVCLIPDCEIKMTKKVDWVQDTQTTDPLKNKERIITLDKELDFNLFDGGGLIDISKARQWAEELELDYIPSVFIIRNIFIKGCLFTMDFHKYAKEIAQCEIVKDLYGNEQNILECDVILTKSQFKLWNAYESMEDYQAKCDKNLNYWGISRVSPKYDDNFFTTNYQFLQVLDLKEEDIKELCEPTIKWLTGVAGLDRNFALLYLLGSMCNKEDISPQDILKLTGDPMVKALIINPEMIKEQYIRQTIIQSINKKIKEAYIGKLVVNGCFNTMIPDPYALMEWTFAEGDVGKVQGLLNEFEHYSHYWNVRGSSEAVGMRSPLTWRSEVNPLHFKKNKDTEEWYQYLTSGTIYNVWGCDCMLHADSDYDGDIVANCDNSIFLKCHYKDIDNSLAITYNKRSVPKKDIEEKNLYKADLDSFDTTIGQVTNYSTSFYDLLCKYKGKTDEYSVKCYNEILERLKLTRKAQGDSIDSAKGIKVDPYPTTWIRRQLIKEEDIEKDKIQKEFLNDICADRKPYFFRYRYPVCDRDYTEFIEAKKMWARGYFQKDLNEILNSDDLTIEEQKFKEEYYRYCPLINYHSPMNNICEYLEDELKIIKNFKKEATPPEVIQLMQTKEVELYEEVEGVLKHYYNEYMDKKRTLKKKQKGVIKPIVSEGDEDNISNIEQFGKVLRQKAEDFFSTLAGEGSLNEVVANYVVEYYYKKYPSKNKSFVWSVFGKYLIENIKKNTLKNTNQTTIPFHDIDGDIEYLGAKYKEYTINIEEGTDVNAKTTEV